MEEVKDVVRRHFENNFIELNNYRFFRRAFLRGGDQIGSLEL